MSAMKYLAGILMYVTIAQGSTPSEIAISIGNDEAITAGGPLIVEITYRFSEPMVASDTGAVMRSIPHAAALQVQSVDVNDMVQLRYVLPEVSLHVSGESGLLYRAREHILYDGLRKKPIFDRPGDYDVTLRAYKLRSNTVRIRVGPPSEADKVAMAILSDPVDYAFLLTGSSEDGQREEREKRLEHVLQQSPDTTLGKWARARLGIEYIEDVRRQDPAQWTETTHIGSERERISDERLVKARRYLTASKGLPKDHPIRQETLIALFKTMLAERDYTEGIALLDELSAAYPNGRYAEIALATKAHLRSAIEQSGRSLPRSSSLWPAIILGCLVIALATALVVAHRRKSNGAS